jgi:hypothetical protein
LTQEDESILLRQLSAAFAVGKPTKLLVNSPSVRQKLTGYDGVCGRRYQSSIADVPLHRFIFPCGEFMFTDDQSQESEFLAKHPHVETFELVDGVAL